jgi:hypothetical protein
VSLDTDLYSTVRVFESEDSMGVVDKCMFWKIMISKYGCRETNCQLLNQSHSFPSIFRDSLLTGANC